MYKILTADSPASIERQLNEMVEKGIEFEICSHSVTIIPTEITNQSPIVIGDKTIGQVRMNLLMFISVLVKIKNNKERKEV